MSPTTHVPTKAYGYSRVSTREQGRSGLGLQAQREMIEQFSKTHGITLCGFVEEVQTGKGHDALTRRPKLAALLKQCRKEKAALIVARTSRLARNVAFGSSILESPVRFIACDAGLNADKLNLHIRMSIDENERQRISENTKSALQAAKRRGRKLGNLTSLRVHRKRGIAVQVARADAFAVSTLPLIEAYQRQGLSLRAIAEQMSLRRIPTAREGGSWYAPMICTMLRRAHKAR
jgi:DNA invertase Pin-like site-specific DNA recombinase